MENNSIQPPYTGWEITLNKKMLIENDDIFKKLLDNYPLICTNTQENIVAIIRKSHPKRYAEPQNTEYLYLLSIYTVATWRHFYLPSNRAYQSIEMTGSTICIHTDKGIKMTSFENLDSYPVLWDQTEDNRRLFFEETT